MMNPHPLAKIGSLMALLVLVLTGCQTAHMPIPETLATAERLPVTGRQGWKIKEHLRFGTYQAHDIDRSWVKGGDLQVVVYERNKRKQQYTFVLREAQADRWRVSCGAFLRVESINISLADITLKDRSSVECRLFALGNAEETWHLKLEEKREGPLAGYLSDAGAQLVVQGTKRLRQGLPAETTTGYEILEAGHPLAAVEVINEGAVWLNAAVSIERRGLLSATAAALLLLEDLRAHLPGERATL